MKNLLLLLLLTLTLSSCYFLGPSPTKRLKTASIQKPYDVAIVPGLPFKNGHWDTLVKTRILWSVYLYKKGIVKKIIYSGGAVYSPYTESKAMALYAIALGVSPDDILLDTLAEHSTENLYYGCEIAKNNNLKTVALTTDPFQCYMLNKFAKKHIENDVFLLPVVYDSIINMTHLEPQVNLDPAMDKNFTPLKERENFKQRLRASKGRRVKK